MRKNEKKPSKRSSFRREIQVEIKSLLRLLAIAAGWFGIIRARAGNSRKFSDTAWYLGNSNAFEGYIGARRIGGR